MASRSTLPIAISQQIWDMKYRFKSPDGDLIDETIEDSWRRVAKAAAKPEGRSEYYPKAGRGKKHDRKAKEWKARQRKKWQRRFYEAMADFAFLPAGRILAGAGTGRAVTLFNCFVMGRIEDDLTSIFANLQEAALTMQQGGGIGHDFSTLRPAGAAVAGIGAEASGPVSFMDVWDAMCRTIMSAGARRGAMMGTMRCDHPDIFQFIAAKAEASRLRNFNLSVLVSDDFIRAVRDDAPWDLVFDGKTYRTVAAIELWQQIMQATYDYAEPGVIFIDRINAMNNLSYCEEISCTNPCITADSWVHTAEGPRQVADLVGRSFTACVNGRLTRSGAKGFFGSGSKRILQLSTRQGYALKLTANHLVVRVAGKSTARVEREWVPAGELVPGDKILLNNHRKQNNWPGRYGRNEGYLLGLLVGDGTLKHDKAVLSVWRPARAMAIGGGDFRCGADTVMEEAFRAAKTLVHRSDFKGWQEVKGRNEFRMTTAAIRNLARDVGMSPGDKAITPLMELSSSTFYRGFLRGFFDADGSIQGNHKKGVSLRLAQSDVARLEAVQRMLLRLGIASTLHLDRRPAGFRELPDGKGASARYAIAAQHELIVSNDNLAEFNRVIGFADCEKQTRLQTLLRGYSRELNHERFIAEVRAIDDAGIEPVYDVEIPGINAFDANGFLVHNCGEQPLPPHGACLLGSINLAALIDKPFTPNAALNEKRLDRLVTTAVRFLDNIIDVSDFPLKAQAREARAKRRIGLGVTGLADALIMAGQDYGSPDGRKMAGRWMARLQRAAYLASSDLAAEKGAFPLFDKDKFLAAPGPAGLEKDARKAIARQGMRNGLVTSIAPTGTISLLAGNLSSGIEPVFDFTYKRRILEPGRGANANSIAAGRAREEIVEDYAYRLFRQSFGCDAALPDSFVTARQLPPSAHLKMQAAVQAHVDSSISKTINCPADMSFAGFKDIYLDAYDLGLKGCTTFRPNAVTGSVLSTVDGDVEDDVEDGVGDGAADKMAGDPAATLTPGAGATDPETDPATNPATLGATAMPTTSSPAPVPTTPSPAPASLSTGGDIVYMAQPLQRDGVLHGKTYKLKWPGSDHAIYVTINDILRDALGEPDPHKAQGAQGARLRPFEIFINSKNLEHYAWTVALTRMISAVFRRGGDVSFVVEELKAIFDPQGGQWMDGHYVPSLLAAIGEIIEAHMTSIGFLRGAADAEDDADHKRAALSGGDLLAGGAALPAAAAPASADQVPKNVSPPRAAAGNRRRKFCPRCGGPGLERKEGCWICRDCGFSRCS